jgi:predicted permease
MNIRRFFAKVRSMAGRGRAEREMAREIEAHLALIQEDFEGRGMAPRDARLAALRAYGGVEQAKELHRDERGFVALEQFLQDARHGVRALRKSPGFTAVALVSLALGIGANTAIFALVNGILLKKLPVGDPENIVQVNARVRQFESTSYSYPAFRELRRQNAVFQEMIGFSGHEAMLDIGGQTRRIQAELVSGSYFAFFGSIPALGRLIGPADDADENGEKVCVLSYQFWRSRFGADPAVIGKIVRVNTAPMRIIGVAPANFIGAELERRYDLWVPTTAALIVTANPRETPNYSWIEILARLKPGVSRAQANAWLRAASPAIEAALPPHMGNPGEILSTVEASRGYDGGKGSTRAVLHEPLAILMGAVLLVLLVACANLANLLLARASERQQEFAIKLSLGISRGRLLRQQMLEVLMLSAVGGGFALAVAQVIVPLLLAIFNTGGSAPLHVDLDASVLAFTFGACILTALIAGLYPAWRASRTEPAPAIKGGAIHSPHREYVRQVLIVTQVGLALVLLFGAALFTHSLGKLRTIDLGYPIERQLSVRVTPDGSHRRAPVAPLSRVLARVRQLPGVESAALADPGTLSLGAMMGGIQTGVRDLDSIYFQLASPGYFAAMGIPLLRGRDFHAADAPDSASVAIVNRSLAEALWPGEDPIGKRFDGWSKKGIEVVGVCADSKYRNIREKMRPIAYLAFDQTASFGGTIEIRCRSPFDGVERDVRRIVKTEAPEYQVDDVSSMELLRDAQIARDRVLAFLSSMFGGLGTTLALVGIYGLISYSVARRTREVGIRMSVGAQRGDVLWLFVRETALLIGLSLALAAPAALWFARWVKAMLYNVSPSDPRDLAIAVSLLAAGGLAASVIPAWRATRVDPVRALRYD